MRIRLFVLLACTLFASSQCQNIARAIKTRIQGMDELDKIDEAAASGLSSTTIVGAAHFYELLSLAKTADLGEACVQDIRRVTSSLLLLRINSTLALLSNFTRKVTLPVLDSSGKPEPGMLKLALVNHGHYTECAAIEYTLKDNDGAQLKAGFLSNHMEKDSGDRHFRADFMRFHNCAVNSSSVFGKTIPELCMPVSCRAADIQNYLNGLSGNASSSACQVVGMQDIALPYDTAYYVVLSFVCALAGFCVVAGIIDYFFSSYVERTQFGSGMLWQLFLAFSFYRNAQSILETSSVNKPGQIGTLHCIRFFSMCWVVMGHTFTYFFEYSNNVLDMMSLLNDLPSQILFNSYFSVDTFFFLSGLLVSFIWFKMFYKNRKATNSASAWIMYYVHRILRLSPAYFIMVIFYTFTFHQWQNSQPSTMSKAFPSDNDKCRKNWYLNLLYLHNYVNYNEYCLPQSWYLSTDMQIFLFTPLLLVPLALKPVIGLATATLAFLLSTAANIYTVYAYHYSPVGILFHIDPEMKSEDYATEELMYAAPYIRCQIYIMGMVVGWALQRYKKMRIHPIINVAGWVLGGALMLTVLFGLYDANKPHDPVTLSLFTRAMYCALSRPAWGLGLSWIIISCFYGYGGPIGKFMSWSIWAPLGRLSYCGYLVHFPLIEYLTGLSYDGYYFTNFTEAFITRVLPYVVITFPAAFIWSCCFELSFGKVEMLLLGGLRAGGAEKKKKQEEEEEIKAEEDGETFDTSYAKEEEEKNEIEPNDDSETKADPSREIGEENRVIRW